MSFQPNEHRKNRERWTAEQLRPYHGKQVAWSLEGTRIVASGDDPSAVCAAVQNSGLTSDEVVLAYVPFPDEVVLGGAWLTDGDFP